MRCIDNFLKTQVTSQYEFLHDVVFDDPLAKQQSLLEIMRDVQDVRVLTHLDDNGVLARACEMVLFQRFYRP